MASITRRGTCVPPGPSRKATGRPSISRARAGNCERIQVRSRMGRVEASTIAPAICCPAGLSELFFSPRLIFSPHHAGALGLDFVHDADLAGLAIGISVGAKVFLGHLVDVLVGVLLGDFYNAAADLEIAVGIF